MAFQDFAAPPARVDRVVVHQFDPARPSPGGIDTCLRGICRYLPVGEIVAIVGVDTGHGPAGRRNGRWERHRVGEQEFWFLPVVSLDPADQARRIPHSVRLIAGIVRHRRRLPMRDMVQVHRMDSALVLRSLLAGPQTYCVHTQEDGLTGGTSDSFWRFLGTAHKKLEQSVVRNASKVIVFNEEYAAVVHRWNPRTVFSPTWYDPALIRKNGAHENEKTLIWVGRLEVPKDPALAVGVLAALAERDPDVPWRLDLLGSGTLEADVAAEIAALPAEVAERVTLVGRVAPDDVAERLSHAGLFLMTSHAGYEGYPRVLVEAMASGLPAVVTQGSDTGALVKDDVTGFTTGRDPVQIAEKVIAAAGLDRNGVIAAVAGKDAPTLIAKTFFSKAPRPTDPDKETAL